MEGLPKRIVLIGHFDSAFENKIQEKLNVGYEIVSVTAQHVAASTATNYNSITLQGKALVSLRLIDDEDAWG